MDSNKNLYAGLVQEQLIEIIIIILNYLSDFENKENRNTIYMIISFGNILNEIKIGNDAENNILGNPSQTIFNILKINGKSYKQINHDIDLW